jgi:hypothetical protein
MFSCKEVSSEFIKALNAFCDELNKKYDDLPASANPKTHARALVELQFADQIGFDAPTVGAVVRIPEKIVDALELGDLTRTQEDLHSQLWSKFCLLELSKKSFKMLPTLLTDLLQTLKEPEFIQLLRELSPRLQDLRPSLRKDSLPKKLKSYLLSLEGIFCPPSLVDKTAAGEDVLYQNIAFGSHAIPKDTDSNPFAYTSPKQPKPIMIAAQKPPVTESTAKVSGREEPCVYIRHGIFGKIPANAVGTEVQRMNVSSGELSAMKDCLRSVTPIKS